MIKKTKTWVTYIVHFMWVWIVVACLSVPTATVYAETEAPDVMRDSEKTTMAGWLLSEVMDLIMRAYVGGEVTPDELYEAALRGISGVLDPYSGYMTEEELDHFTDALSGKLMGIGVTLWKNDAGQAEITKVLPETPASTAGLQAGDIITAVNGLAVGGYSVDDIVGIVTDPEQERALVTVLRGDQTLTFDILKATIHLVTVEVARFEKILSINTAAYLNTYRYVQITSISETTAESFAKELAAMQAQGVKRIVLDLRGNPGGYLQVAVDICRMLVPVGPILHTLDKAEQRQTIYSTLPKSPFDKIVVLVDRGTASAAEVITAALQDAGAAVVVGETTYGKGVIQSLYPMRTGGGFKLTTEVYLRRSGEPIHQIGVTPDVPLTLPESLVGVPVDWMLIQALEVLRQ